MEAVWSPSSLFRDINCTFPISAPAGMVSAAVPRVVCSTCVAVEKHNQRSTTSRDNSSITRTKTKTGPRNSWPCFAFSFKFFLQELCLFYCVAGRLQTITTGGRGRGIARKLNLEISPHRAVSAVRLMRIELGGAFADLLNEQGKGSGDNEMGYVERTLGFRTRDVDDRDLRLVTQTVGGTTRWKRYLDHLILSLCHDENTITSMEPLLLQILRIGFYEIVKLEMPPYAVVDENVKLAKAALRVGAGNMVNALLRKLVSLKERSLLPEPKVDGDDRQRARALATIHSHPVWMVRRWINHLGLDEAIKFMTWNNTDPGFSIRANIGKGFTRADLIGELEKLKVPYELSQHLDDFVRIRTGMQVIIQAGLLKKGFCSVQDESAGLVVTVVDPKPGDSIIDCCAAPGGKTLFMASCLNRQGSIRAVDVNKGRLRILKETAKLQELDQVITTIHADLRTLDSNCLKGDKVLLDAPCSGLGVLSKVYLGRPSEAREDLLWPLFCKIERICAGIGDWKTWRNL